MKLIDYREKLGIGFNDEEKFAVLKNKIFNLLKIIVEDEEINNEIKIIFFDYYFIGIGERYRTAYLMDVINNIDDASNMAEFVFRYTVFKNGAQKHFNNGEAIFLINNSLNNVMDELKIPYEIITDDDGEFLFPKGAKELDNALVSDVLDWLIEYPQTRKTYTIALRQYANGDNPRDVADNLRKAFEEFLQELLGNTQNLDNNKKAIKQYLGSKNVAPEFIGIFHQLIATYEIINNKYAKHNDNVDQKLLEFLLYQTGVLIRTAIMVSKS